MSPGDPAASIATGASLAGALAAAPERLLHDWRQAHQRVQAYLAMLEVPAAEIRSIAAEAVRRAVTREQWEPDGDAYSESLRAMREIAVERLGENAPVSSGALEPFTAWRFGVATQIEGAPASTRPVSATPPLQRRRMPLAKLVRRFARPRTEPLPSPGAERAAPAREPRSRRELPWTRVAVRRRLTLGVLVLIPSVIASQFMLDVLPSRGGSLMELAITLFFGALFGWISIGFWTAMLGFFTLLRRRDRFAITTLPDGESLPDIDPATRIAIVMPICEEPVERVFAGLRAIHDSLEATGTLERFDFFVMSDSADPATWVREEDAWLRWCRETDGFGRIFYRRRRVRLKRKNGNVADFCRRWGSAYRYMIMLDADSVMSGDTLVRLVQLMERHPTAGMIQTAPAPVHRRSVFGRVQQFAARVYGPMFAAGLHYWQLGDGQYWGHNTIIRVEPFMDHCGLPPLPGKPPLGGDILSHDFVEAALMGRAGWTLWLAFDLGGSYEETPSSLLEEMKRDRRWCQGNLQHVRLLFTEGLFGAHRALFLNGALSYVSALLWFSFLLLSTAEAIRQSVQAPEYFPAGPSLFPEWPVWRPDWALMLLAVTCIILFLPKVLSVMLVLFHSRTAHAYGGALRLLASVPIEIVLSGLFAPIRMVFHTKFVLLNLAGRTVGWKSQPREDAETGWWEAVSHHGADTLFATVWAGVLLQLNPDYFWWLLPVVGALLLSIPISVLVSKIGLGDAVRRLGLFQIPEETHPPVELVELERLLGVALERTAAMPAPLRDGFALAAVDPRTNALHRGLLGPERRLSPAIRRSRRALLEGICAAGPDGVEVRARRAILSDPDLVEEIHWRLWRCDDVEHLRRWGVPV